MITRNTTTIASAKSDTTKCTFSDNYFFAFVKCRNIECLLYCGYKDDTVAMFTASCSFDDYLQHSINVFVRNDYLKLNSRQQIIGDGLTSPLQMKLPLLTPAGHRRNCHTTNSHLS